MAKILSYEEKDTWIHRLSGVTKLIFFLLWCLTSMLTYDTRVLAVMLALALIIFKASRTQWKQVGAVFKLVLVFLVFNVVAIYLFSPDQGTEIYGTRTVLFHIAGRYDITKEQLFYELNVVLKYFTVIPAVFMFLVTTNPSEFAASLSRIGVSYNVGYAISIALRYIPDVQGEFTKIRHAMELRGFGKHRKRTWYMEKKLRRGDYLAIIFTVIFSAAALAVTFADGSRFYNPFG